VQLAICEQRKDERPLKKVSLEKRPLKNEDLFSEKGKEVRENGTKKAACPNLMFPVSRRELAPSNWDI